MPKNFLMKSFPSGEGLTERLSDLKDIWQSPFDWEFADKKTTLLL